MALPHGRAPGSEVDRGVGGRAVMRAPTSDHANQVPRNSIESTG